MKKKVLMAFLSMSMLGTSLAPVSEAEFTSGEETAVVKEEVEPDLTIDDFSEGDSEETPVFNNDIENSDAANYEDDDEINVKSIHIIKQPTKDTYYYGLDAEVVGDLDFSGVTAQVLYKDGTTETITFSSNDEDVEDHHGNTFSIFIYTTK